MPQLPGIRRLPPAQAGSLGRRATPEDVGAGASAARGQRAGLFSQLGGAAAEVADVRNRIRRATDQTAVARTRAETVADLDGVEFEFENDSKLDDLEERSEKRISDLLGQRRKELPPELHQAFDDEVFSDAAQARLRIARGATSRRIKKGVADLDRSRELGAIKEAQELDPARRAQLRGRDDAHLQAALEAGLIDQAGYDDRVRKRERAVADADLLRALRDDPAGAFEEMQDPQSPLLRGRSEVERQQALDQAVKEHAQQMGERRAAARFAQEQADRMERERRETTMKDLDDLAAKEDRTGLAQRLQENRGLLDPEDYRRYLSHIDGTARTPKTVPELYLQLSDLAAKGDPDVMQLARTAHRQGSLDQDDLHRIEQSSEDVRFGEARRLLKNSFQQPMFRSDQVQQARNAEAERAFSDFVKDHRGADRNEAMAYARDLIRWTGVADLGGLPPADLQQLQTEAGGIIDLFNAGLLSQEDLDRRIEELDRREDASRRAVQKQ